MTTAIHADDEPTQNIDVLDDLHEGDRVEFTYPNKEGSYTFLVIERLTDERYGDEYEAVLLSTKRGYILVHIDGGEVYGSRRDGNSEGRLATVETATKVETGPLEDDFYDRNPQLDRAELLRGTQYGQLVDNEPSWSPDTDVLSFENGKQAWEEGGQPGDWWLWGCDSDGEQVYFLLGGRDGIHVTVGYVPRKDCWFACLLKGVSCNLSFEKLFDEKEDAERFAYALMANAGNILENGDDDMADYDWWQAE